MTLNEESRKHDIEESIKNKLDNLCNVMGTLEYRIVKHKIYKHDTIDNNILTMKKIFNELKNKIVLLPSREAWTIQMFNYYKTLTTTLYNIERSKYGDSTNNKPVFLNDLEESIRKTVELKDMTTIHYPEEMFNDIIESAMYGLHNNFFEITIDNKLLQITNDNWPNIDDYFSNNVIRYALLHNIKIPYVNLNGEVPISHKER